MSFNAIGDGAVGDLGAGDVGAVDVGSGDLGPGGDIMDVGAVDVGSGDFVVISDVDDDVQIELEKAKAMRKSKGKAKVQIKSTVKGHANMMMKIAAHGIRMRSERVNASVKGKEKSVEKVKKSDKGKEKLIGTSDKVRKIEKEKKIGKGKEKLSETSGKAKTIDKGKNKVGGDKSEVAEEDHAKDDPSFVDSDYDLSEHEEDAIMAAQVEGWKRVVDVMATHLMEHVGDTSDNDQLPSDSPSTGTEDEKELDYDSDKRLSRRYKAATDINDPRWEVGMLFNCKNDFTVLIRHQGVVQGKKLRFKKNDKIRCVAFCRGVLRSKKSPPCPWFVQIRFRAAHGFWQISRLRNKHKCGGVSFNHGCANSKYLSKKYKEDIRLFPGMTVGQFIEKVHFDMKITISSGKAKRSMQQARKMVQVDLVRQYKRLQDYRAEILRSNPGSTVVLSTQRLTDGSDRFKGIHCVRSM